MGHDVVFADLAFPPAVLQHPVDTVAGRFVLDRAYLAELVGVELGAILAARRRQLAVS